MNPSSAQRHHYILQRLQEQKHIDVLDLCEALNVSAVTIRKDLKLLEEKELLFRTHGGAALENPYIKDRPVDEKKLLYVEEKTSIATAAAALISAQEAVIIASGTTMVALARALPPHLPLTVITSALNVGLELVGHPEIEVLQLGGYLRHSSSSVTGPQAEQVLADISCQKLFLGVDGIDLDFGFTTTNSGEAHLNQAMLRAAQETIVLADSSKFGKRGFSRICGFEQVHRVITDRGISPQDAKKLEERSIALTIV
ncbi:DeoR/GlpR family DNA-binding transcription regulator [uncultured Hymenobacter sp.]|uniref:DeoR/GlpR family DNA-binding transcription regulator n=1 Tax=uncultured Hymenobacter sp. TaxID=170016 RepID=UPI0035CA1BA6